MGAKLQRIWNTMPRTFLSWFSRLKQINTKSSPRTFHLVAPKCIICFSPDMLEQSSSFLQDEIQWFPEPKLNVTLLLTHCKPRIDTIRMNGQNNGLCLFFIKNKPTRTDLEKKMNLKYSKGKYFKGSRFLLRRWKSVYKILKANCLINFARIRRGGYDSCCCLN